MSVEILVHSQSGHCFSVAETLAGLARVAGQGGQVVATGIIHWDRKDREEQIEAFSRQFSQVLQSDPDSEPEVGG